ncbi:DNA polymerase III subunit gamma/tau [Litoribrevibacter albus]|uniref:DNA polymerase III subunit gamma/tau n=1 Tax=Litoribrevibacter albus TaxID=1473156 RepID=A0AA37W6K9_9GAMM|nr:DNA polymerase III subunit gamma/tau [Litoribrevibacter albus]GLQ30029.1 DNA polymerase III subunit gamma/tau [Litoribrevibacter albus]
MSYHVLARRWRPQTFTEMVGQEHVLKALTNALSHDRLHHAYLFTGTRGVGKTTVARIFAKSLNCEQGVGPNPCGVCSACTEITEGRFVDLIEVDAASRTKVEDTRELLENVQYSPSRGRFKVYIIDEVHMLSTSSFNALLKTLEEPPEHVKFLLATTDPQKLPVTVLSRCLQFNLKNMSPERIVSHLKYVLGQEQVPFEEPALWLLAKAADGSMRDALSLTDQSIAFGNESVMEADVRNMLGTVDRAYVLHILEALAKQDAAMVLDEVARASDHAPDFAGILDELIAVLHRVGVGQMVPAAIDNSQGDQEYILGMAQAIQPQDVHLFYQIALASRKDMAAAADQRAALEMTLLRMLAFQIKRPGQTLAVPQSPLPNSTPVSPSPSSQANPSPQVEPADANTQVSQSEPSASMPETVGEPTAQATQVASVEPSSVQSESVEPVNVEHTSVETEFAQPAPVNETAVAVENVTQLPPQTTQTAAPEYTESVPPMGLSPEELPPFDYDEQDYGQPQGNEPAQYNEPTQSLSAMGADEAKKPEPTPFAESQGSAETAFSASDSSDEPVVDSSAISNQLSAIQQTLASDAPMASPDSMQSGALASSSVLAETSREPEKSKVLEPDVTVDETSDWLLIESRLTLDNFSANLAANMVPVERGEDTWGFVLTQDMETFLNNERKETLAKALSEVLGKPLKITIEPGTLQSESPAEYRIRKKAERLQLAITTFHEDKHVVFWKTKFGGQVLEETVVPID